MFRRFNIFFVLMLPAVLLSAGHTDFIGEWELVPPKSTTISLYGSLFVEFQIDGDEVTVIQQWGTRARDSYRDTVRLKTDGKAYSQKLQHQVAPTTIFLGVANIPGGRRNLSASWNSDGTELTLQETLPIRVSQGRSEMTATHSYTLNAAERLVTYRVSRAARKNEPPLEYLLKPRGSRHAFFMRMEDDWDISGKLPLQAMLISLQGVANADGPHLYFIYGEKWDFKYTPGLFDFLKNERYFTFRELKSAEQALTTFRDKIKGYVVWDKSERTSLIVAYTVAGLEQAVVVSEELIPLVQKAGLEPVADFRGKFTGWSDAQIYRWAKEQYWDRCSRETIVWLGGEHGTTMRPGVADWGMHKKMFFNDL
ncbi:hypothetical protein JW992_06560, partial [candidate division KSB1 bacterium]|nr:hypothetical protein [candidate division KSB1 bacterium]